MKGKIKYKEGNPYLHMWSNTMKEELRKKLVDKYPKIFSPDFIFEHGDGWYWLIDKLCTTLQFNTNYNNMPQIKAAQIKEKFGTLRFYHKRIEGGTPKCARGIISLAEELSSCICEECGASGATTRNNCGWLSTKCIKCSIQTEDLDPDINRMVNKHF